MSKSETNTILRTARHWGASWLSCADGEGQRTPVGNVTDRSVNRSAFGQEVGHARDRVSCLVRATVELELRVLRFKYEYWREGVAQTNEPWVTTRRRNTCVVIAPYQASANLHFAKLQMSIQSRARVLHRAEDEATERSWSTSDRIDRDRDSPSGFIVLCICRPPTAGALGGGTFPWVVGGGLGLALTTSGKRLYVAPTERPSKKLPLYEIELSVRVFGM